MQTLSVSTWSFRFPVCDAAQSEDDSSLILLNDLQDQKHKLSSCSQQQRKLWFQLLSPLCLFSYLAHLQTKPDRYGEEQNCEQASEYNYDPAARSQRPCAFG